MSRFTTKDFHWYGPKRLFVSEASKLGYAPNQHPEDSITVKSEQTGREVRFVAHDLIEDPEGDLIAWVFRPEDQSVKCELHILND